MLYIVYYLNITQYMFLIDKYRPTNATEAFFHKELLELFTIMSQDEAIPHIILYGPEGSGKKTMRKIFLEMLFDASVNNTKPTKYRVVGSGNKKTDELIKQSSYHIEIDPKGNNSDRYLIHDVVKKYAKRGSLNVYDTKRQFKVVLINNLDNLSYYAQTSLRRTMERYDSCRFIMWCNSLSKIIKPLQSRCVCLRIPAPTDSQLFSYVLSVSVKENISLSIQEYHNIIKSAKGNIKVAMWHLDYMKYGYEFNTNYDQSIVKLTNLILAAKLENVKEIRDLLHSLMITNVIGTTILRDIITSLCLSDKITDEVKYDICSSGASIECQLIKGRREIIQFAAFVITSIRIIHHDKQKNRTKKLQS
jgi:replication factor C subunit 3/5